MRHGFKGVLRAFRWMALSSAWVVAAPVTAAAQSRTAWLADHGAMVGAAVGIATGFGLARATDYPLKEGGAFTVASVGGILGALHGHRLAASADRPWREPGRLQVTFPWAVVWSGAPDDIRGAMAASGVVGSDDHHAIAPAVTLLYDAIGPLRFGGEASGVRGVRIRGDTDFGRTVESVDGRVFSGLLVLGTRPTEQDRLTYAVGAGLDHYRLTVRSWLDQFGGLGLPADASQPGRSAVAEADRWGVHARAGIEFYLTDEVSVGVGALRRWNDPVSVPGIRLMDAQGATVAAHGVHSVNLRSFQVTLGFGLRFGCSECGA